MWRAYDVGNGKDVPYNNFPLKEETELPSLTKISDVPNIELAFVEVKPRKHQAAKGAKISTDDDNDESSATDDDTLFTCSEDKCVKTFQRFSSLQNIWMEVNTTMSYRGSPSLTRQWFGMLKI